MNSIVNQQERTQKKRGRPALDPTERRETVTMRLRPESLDYLDKQASALNTSRGQLIEALLHGYRQQVANPKQLTLDLSRIG